MNSLSRFTGVRETRRLAHNAQLNPADSMHNLKTRTRKVNEDLEIVKEMLETVESQSFRVQGWKTKDFERMARVLELAADEIRAMKRPINFGDRTLIA